jgi:hypothetical protein
MRMTVLFAAVLVAVQQFEHTALAFSLLFFMFTVLSAAAFNLSGGMNRPTGSYVLAFSLLTVIVAVVMKAVLGEPADSNMEAPLLTMTVYTFGMAIMLCAILLKNRLVGFPRGLGLVLGDAKVNLTFSAIGCLLVGAAIVLLGYVFPSGSGTVLSALNQINILLPLGLILNTVDVVQKSDGRRSLNALSLTVSLVLVGFGMTGFSKQGIFTPIVAWVIGSLYGGLRWRWTHALTLGAILVAAGLVFVPIANFGRSLAVGMNLTQRAQLVILLAENSAAVRAQNAEALAFTDANASRHGYFNKSLGLGDRAAMFQVDSGLINYVDTHGPVGFAPLQSYLENILPHFIDPNKDAPGKLTYGGNYYAHMIGGYLAPDDFTTGISFGFLGESFAMGEWTGIFLLAPILWFLLFCEVELIAGDLRTSPWGLLPLLLFLHVAPESLVNGIINFMWTGCIGLTMGIWFCVVIAPVLGSVFGTSLVRRRVVRQLGETTLARPRAASTA